MNTLSPTYQNLAPQQQLKFLNNEQQLLLREARRQERIAKRSGKAGLIADASDAQARARKALKQARQLSVLITNLRRDLREQQKQSRNGSTAASSIPIHAANESRVTTPQ
jgi:hypothetical protein